MNQRLKSRCSTFSKETTFHGFHELRKSKRWYERCAWILIMSACTGMLCYQIAMQVDQYLDGEVVTRSARLKDEDQPYAFPKIVLFLSGSTWIDVSKAETLNFTYEEILVAQGYLRSHPYDKPLEYESEIPVEMAKESLRSKMMNLGIAGIREVFSMVAWIKLNGLHDGTGSILLTTFSRDGAFYNLNLSDVKKAAFSKAWKYQMRFNYSAYWDSANKTMDFLEMAEGEKQSKATLYNPDTEQEITLQSDHRYMISVGCNMYRRLYGCLETSHPYYRATCKLDCRLQAYRHIYSCVRANDSHEGEVIEISRSFLDGSINLCHLGVLANGSVQGVDVPQERILSEQEQRDRDSALEDCKRQCLPECERFTSTWSVSDSQCEADDEECAGMASVTAAFPDSESLVITEEIERYKWHDIVSNIGGLLGLWLGASIMSIFQAIHLCCWEDGEKVVKAERSCCCCCEGKMRDIGRRDPTYNQE